MNKEQVVKRLYADARTLTAWANMRDLRPSTVHALLDGKTRPSTKKALVIIKALKADGYLTDEDLGEGE